MKITTRVKDYYDWVELIIEDGNTKLEIDLYEDDLNQAKIELEQALKDIIYLIDKIENDK